MSGCSWKSRQRVRKKAKEELRAVFAAVGKAIRVVVVEKRCVELEREGMEVDKRYVRDVEVGKKCVGQEFGWVFAKPELPVG